MCIYVLWKKSYIKYIRDILFCMVEEKSESYGIDINTTLIDLFLSCLLCNTAVFIKFSFAIVSFTSKEIIDV